MSAMKVTAQQRNRIMVLLLGAIVVVLTQTAISPALPSIMKTMNVDASAVQWLTSAYAMTEAVIIPLAAWFMGRFKSKHLFAAMMFLFGMGSVVSLIAPVFGLVLFGRVLQAVAAGIGIVMVMALIMLAFPREHRGKAMGVVSLVIGFAPAVGPFAGGLIVDSMGWRSLFLIVAVAAVLIGVLALMLMGEDDGFPPATLDIPSIIFSTIGLVTLLYGISSISAAANLAMPTGFLVVGFIFIGLFARRQFSMETPLLRLDAFRSARYCIAIITVMFLQAILIGLVVLMPIYIQSVLGQSATVSGLVILPGALIGALAGLRAGGIFDRYGISNLALCGAALLVVSGIGMFLYGISSPLWFVIAANIINGICIQLLITPLITWGVNSLSNDLVQHATAVTNTMNQVGGAVGTALIILFSAIGSSVSTSTSDLERLYDGCHFSYSVVFAFSLIVLLLVVFVVRKLDKQPVKHEMATTSDTILNKSARDVMSDDLLVITEGTSISVAANQLATANANGAVVVDDGGAARGFVSNIDVLEFFGEKSGLVVSGGEFAAITMIDNDENIKNKVAQMSSICVEDLASDNLISVSPNASFEEVCRRLVEWHLKELPVIEDGKPIGVVHRRALMRFISEAINETAAEVK